VFRAAWGWWRSEQGSCLDWDDGVDGNFAPVAQLKEGRQAARGKTAPAGAKGWLRESMCQIASVSLRAMSIWATLAPR
jgi:hypothetical protein